jgi:FHA domain/Zinc-ribbon containing domain
LSTISAEAFETGTLAGAGSFVCLDCGYAVRLKDRDVIPECPGCGSGRFRRASLFEHGEHLEPTTIDLPAVQQRPKAPEWLDALREQITEPGACFAFMDSGHVSVVPISDGWMRIGRSRSADLRLDHPTVSRRHAIVVRTDRGSIRALDDRSLNGLFVNGEPVDWSPLKDGDELSIGRYSLYLLIP